MGFTRRGDRRRRLCLAAQCHARGSRRRNHCRPHRRNVTGQDHRDLRNWIRQFAFRDGLHRRVTRHRVARTPRSHAAGRPLDVEDEVYDGRKAPCRLPRCASDHRSCRAVVIGGPAQAVRPLVVPMAEAAARRTHPRYTRKMREKLRSYASSADTIGLFFGEDVFIAIGSILLITGFVDATYNLKLEALQIALWAIPTAICAFLIHAPRLWLLDRKLAKMAAEGGDDVDVDEIPEPGHTVSLPSGGNPEQGVRE